MIKDHDQVSSQAMKISSWVLKHPVPAIITTVAILFAGLLAIFNLKWEFIPTITEPTALVVTIWPGSSAEEVEKQITSVLEDHFIVLQGLVDMHSESREGASIIRLQFDEQLNVDLLIQDVRAQVDKTSRILPPDILGKPVVSRAGSMSIPVFSLAVSGSMEPDALYSYVKNKVIPELHKVKGVAQVKIYGDYRKVVEIRLNIGALNKFGITPLEILSALKTRNTYMPAGLVEWEGQEWPFRVSGIFVEISDIENLIISPPGTLPITLAEVAEIDEVYSESDERVRSNGRDSLVLHITKRDEGHTTRMSRDLKEVIDNIDDLNFVVLHDDSGIVRQSLTSVSLSALTGLLIVMVVIWLFLREPYYTVIIGASLPISLMATIACMWVAGLSINVLTMAGIAISIGMVVDASVVVLDSIQRSRINEPDAYRASMIGVSQVAGAVTAFILTSVCIFLPILLLKGIIGSVLKDISLTIIFILLASLFAAIVILPHLAKIKPIPADRNTGRKLIHWMENSYRKSLTKVLHKPSIVILVALAILSASILAAGLVGISFIPAADYNELFVSMQLEPGSSLDESVETADRIEQMLRREIPAIGNVFFYVGMEDDLSGDSRNREALWGHVLLRDKRDKGQDFRSIIRHANRILSSDFPEAKVFNGGFDRLLMLATDGTGFRIELASESAEDLNRAAKQAESLLAQDPEILSTELGMDRNRLSVTALMDNDSLNEQNISVTEAALVARIAFAGIETGEYKPASGPSRHIVLNSNLKNREPNTDILEELKVRNRLNQTVSFSKIANVVEEESASSIIRHNRKRIITVTGYTKNENIRGVSKRFKDGMADLELPPSVTWRVEGIGGLVNESMVRLGIVLMISLFLVYAVMAIQFDKLMQPLIVMAVVPFCFIGVVGGLLIFGSDISLISFLGIIALGGIVVNNAIVLIDRINQLRRNGMNTTDAIVEGSASRLRPILMTTLTTFFGMLPLVLDTGVGARVYAPLGQTIAGGLASSTLVTLFLIPVLYLLSCRKKPPV